MTTKFINPALVIAQTGLTKGQVAADLGCGSGFYIIPAAQLVGNEGMVYAVDVQEAKLAATSSLVQQMGYKNVKFLRADLSKPLMSPEPHSCDLVVIGNILHEIDSPEALLQNAYRLLKVDGRLLVVEWKKEITPLGPPVEKRLSQQQLEVLLMRVGLRKEKELETDGYHYSVLFRK